jgi:hypothetical protein
MEVVLALIREVTLNQLHGATGLNSLKIQNHIYGCYVVMEDISQGILTVEGGKLIGSKLSFDLEGRFEELGVRFGFLADTKLILDDCLAEYKNAWMALFAELSKSRAIDKSDAVEDAVNEIIVKEIKEENAFFVNAIDTGMLPHEWLDRAISLLTGRALSPSGAKEEAVTALSQEEEVPVEDTAISHAHTEKAILHTTKRKPLASTRRHKEAVVTVVPKKKWLNVTRRHHARV